MVMTMIEGKLIADLLASIGSVIGIYSKGYQLFDCDTVISRKSSLPNIAAYPITAIGPFLYLELYFLTFTSIISFTIWIGLYFFRAPDPEDWLGRTILIYDFW
jgi:hypothetical protein